MREILKGLMWEKVSHVDGKNWTRTWTRSPLTSSHHLFILLHPLFQDLVAVLGAVAGPLQGLTASTWCSCRSPPMTMGTWALLPVTWHSSRPPPHKTFNTSTRPLQGTSLPVPGAEAGPSSPPLGHWSHSQLPGPVADLPVISSSPLWALAFSCPPSLVDIHSAFSRLPGPRGPVCKLHSRQSS